MARAQRKTALGPLEENGIVRNVVFPNAVRDVRRQKGFPTLRAFDTEVDVTYTRLAKIERGEIFPTGDELKSIARAMQVPVASLLIDQTDPTFNREAWAREHIEAKLEHRGGGLPAMKLGAAMRVRRQALGRSTTDMKSFSLPAATVSRIENADRSIERWDDATQKGIAKFIGARGNAGVMSKVDELFEAGDLDEMLNTLFSPDAIEERNRKRLKALLAELPGVKIARMLKELDVEDVAVMTSKAGEHGIFTVSQSNRRVSIPANASRQAYAVEVAEAVLGPGLPVGTIIVADPDQTVSSGDVAVILSKSRKQVIMLSISEDDGGLYGFSLAMDKTIPLSQLPDGSIIGKMVASFA